MYYVLNWKNFWGVCISKIFITKICILLYGLNIFNFKPLNFIKNLIKNFLVIINVCLNYFYYYLKIYLFIYNSFIYLFIYYIIIRHVFRNKLQQNTNFCNKNFRNAHSPHQNTNLCNKNFRNDTPPLYYIYIYI